MIFTCKNMFESKINSISEPANNLCFYFHSFANYSLSNCNEQNKRGEPIHQFSALLESNTPRQIILKANKNYLSFTPFKNYLKYILGYLNKPLVSAGQHVIRKHAFMIKHILLIKINMIKTGYRESITLPLRNKTTCISGFKQVNQSLITDLQNTKRGLPTELAGGLFI